MLVPSLLEYSPEALQKKLDTLAEHAEYVATLQSGNSLSLHLDFVLEFFAKDRNTMMSLSLAKTLAVIGNNLKNKPLNLSIHLMGSTEDLLQAYRFFEFYHVPEKWTLTVYVPEKYTSTWRNSALESNSRDRVTIGTWYDLDEWQNLQNLSPITTNFLLMTVMAGKSGQKSDEQTKSQAIILSDLYSEQYFILDGGWKMSESEEVGPNTQIISYTDFWDSILEVL